MSYNYPTPGMSGLQSGMPVDQAGYPIRPQNPAMGGYLGPGLAPGGAPAAAYPPIPQPSMPAPYGGYPVDPYGPGGAPVAYPPMMGAPGGGAPPPGGVGLGAYGGLSPNELYMHGQQYGLSRSEVDGALAAYREMDSMERSRLSSLSLSHVMNLLRRIFGNTPTSDQFIAPLGNTLLSNLTSGRLPGVKEFLSMLGMNKTQYGKTQIPYAPQAAGTGFGAVPGAPPQFPPVPPY